MHSVQQMEQRWNGTPTYDGGACTDKALGGDGGATTSIVACLAVLNDWSSNTS